MTLDFVKINKAASAIKSHMTDEKWTAMPIGNRHSFAFNFTERLLGRLSKVSPALRYVRINTRGTSKTRLGWASFRFDKPAELTLTEWTIELLPWSDIEDTVRHEVAHLIAGHEAGHGPIWKNVAAAVGAAPERVARVKGPPAKWIGTCRKCGHTWRRHRLSRRVRQLGMCCGVFIDWVDTTTTPALAPVLVAAQTVENDDPQLSLL